MSPFVIIITIIFIIIIVVVGFVMHIIIQQKDRLFQEKIQQQLVAFNLLAEERNALLINKDAFLERAIIAESRTTFLDEQYNLYQQLLQQHQTLQNQLTTANVSLKNADDKLLHQKLELNNMGEKFKFEFRSLAQSIMEEKAAKFTEVNEQKMNEILSPFKIQLGEFKQRVEDTYDKESKERFSLGKEVERLINMTQQVSIEANNLTTALKGNNKMQGNWGEMILESILENSGLAKNRDYFLQEFIRDNAGNVIKDEHGKGLQPDATIVYPDKRKVIIDSKVSLVAWDASIAIGDLVEQQKFLQEHVKSIRQHVDGLSKKNYPKYASALDYVLLFVPIEPAYLEALKADTQLWKYAYDKNVLLVSATNLFAVLKIVADLWKVEKQSKNAIEIADKAGALYDKFVGFIENFELVGKRITDASAAFEQAHKQISLGKGNLTNRVEELKQMGANANKQLPATILQNADYDLT